MPSSPEELRQEWPEMDHQAIEHLTAKGFTPTRDFCWIMPYKEYVLTQRDHSALNYLALEWDYGGLIDRGVGLKGEIVETPDELVYVRPQLHEFEQYFLGLLSEEAAEIIKMAAGKTSRFGFRTPGKLKADGEPDFDFTPEKELHDEVGDILAAIELCFRYGILNRQRVYDAEKAKIIKLMTEKDNLGRPLMPKMPDLPIRGPDGSIWEPEQGGHREFPVFEQEKETIVYYWAMAQVSLLKGDLKGEQSKPKMVNRLWNWFSRNKSTALTDSKF